MTCEELRADYLLYAMGALGEPEAAEIRSHLDSGCQVCAESLRQAHAMAYSMGADVNGPDAPRALRGRVLAIAGPEADNRAAGRERRASFWAVPMARWQGWALAAGCFLLALAPAIVWQRQSLAREASSAALLEREEASAAALRSEVAKLEAPPVQAVPIFALEIERGAEGEPKQLAIPRGAPAIVLALPSDLVRQASSAEVRNASGLTVSTVSPLPASDADSTGLTISAKALPPGNYTIVLLAGGRTLARFPFTVAAR